MTSISEVCGSRTPQSSLSSFSGTDANFCSAVFSDQADFRGATFNGKALFVSATFNGEAIFSSTQFRSKGDFAKATFLNSADFRDATFVGEDGTDIETIRAAFGLATFKQGAYFRSVRFGSKASFTSAKFEGAADFELGAFLAGADFFGATFNASADFEHVKFCGDADFATVTFGERASFVSAIFEAFTYFRMATFNGETDFTKTTFKEGLVFEGAILRDHVRFEGRGIQSLPEASAVDFQYARIEQPGHVSFHTLTLCPHWFVNVDARRCVFINVRWTGSLSEDIQSSERLNLQSANRLLSLAYRQLAVNAEENHRYEEASRFRYWSMDTLRLERWRGFAFWKLSWWYWLLSGYGERVSRACSTLLVVWFLFAVLYTQVGFARWQPALTSESDLALAKRDEVGEPLEWPEAATYSLGVMSLQRPEPRPTTPVAQGLVTLETILGPFQSALLALAIRRKFMR